MAALDDFLREALALVPPSPKCSLEYRVYFDQHGDLLFYTMEDLPGNYVVIDREFYAGSPTNVRLRDGKLTIITTLTGSKLVPSTEGISCDARDVTVVSLESPCQKWTRRTYDQDH